MPRFPVLRRWLAPAAVSALAVVVASCGKPTTKSTAPGTPGAPVAVGPALYPAKAPPDLAAASTIAEPVVASQGVVQFDETVTLSAEVDGKLELVATPLDPTKTYDLADPKYANRLMEHPRKPEWKLVRVIDGDPIARGQILAMLDDSQAILDVTGLTDSKRAADGAKKQTAQAVKEYEELSDSVEKVGTLLEKANARVNVIQAKTSLARLEQEYVKYAGDLEKAQDRKRRHYLRADFDGKVVRVLQPRGVVVKAGDPILEVQNTSRFRVEAQIDGEVADRLKPYLPVVVEPVRALTADPYTARHRQEVTGVAVFTVGEGKAARPVVVSASADGTALVWDAKGEKRAIHVLPHPPGVGVRCVAAAAKGEQRLVVTGGSDGKVRVWDTTDLARLPDKPMAEFEDAHSQAVSAAAFSPDGKYLATASGREVFLWDVDAKKRKYALPAKHRDDVKAVQFTPQATLVTVSRDRAIRVWTPGTDGATLLRTFDHRSGVVDILGVSADGGRVLFDQDAGRIDLVSLADGRTTGSLVNSADGLRFSRLAVFGADGETVLTAAGDADAKGELQLWTAPAAGRGTERKRLVTPGRTAVTAAAFSPDPSNPFVAVGTQSGVVHFWTLPPLADQPKLTGRLVSITRTDARSALIRVEVEAPPGGKFDDQLQDKGLATLIIDPLAKPLPPVLPAPPVAPVPGGPAAAK